MKSYLITGGVILICVLIALSFWKFGPNTEPLKIKNNTNTAETPITVNPLEPTVSITQSTTTDFSEIKETVKTSVGSKIKTGSVGRALIESSSNHQTLIDYNTEVTVSDDSKKEKKTKIALASGAVWARLSKVFDSGEYYEVKTGNAVATVRGTSFGVWYRNGFTTVVVTEGSIYLSAVDPNTGEVIPNTEVIVKAGQKATLGKDGKISISKITSFDKQEPWYIYNNPEDKTPVTVTTPTPKPVSTTTNTTPTTPTVVTPTTVQTPFTITSIIPTSADNGAGTIITLKGDGFQKLKSIIIGRNSVTNYRIVSPTNIQIMTDGLPPGTFNVSIIDINNNVSTAGNQLTITEAPTTQPTTEIYYTAPLQ